jgi:hypothetical protein
MIIKVMYHDRTYDMVYESLLDQLIREGKVMKFYRPSEGWITVGRRPVRGRGGAYQGPDRRRSGVPSPPPVQGEDASE